MTARTALFEDSVRETHAWIIDLSERLGFIDEAYALHGLLAVLHALRDELSAQQNAALAAQMPALLRGMYFQDWKPVLFEPRHCSQHEFLFRVDRAFHGYAAIPDPRLLTEQVFALLEDRIGGECRKIRRTLPDDLSNLWPLAGGDLDEQ